MMVNDAPRYIVKQKIPTPMRHITVAIIVAYGMRVMHALKQFPVDKIEIKKNEKNDRKKCSLIDENE